MHADHAPVTPATDPARLIEENRLLRADAHAARTQRAEWRTRALAAETENHALAARVKDLERRLRFYENENTPPSQRTLKPNAKKKPATPASRRRGAPKGHKGATRKTPPIDRILDVTAAICPQCGAEAGEPTGVDVRTITERPEPAPVTTTQYNLATYACACGHAFLAPHPEVPTRGVWGPLLLTHFTLLAFLLRGRIRRCVAFLLDQDGIPISIKGFWDAIQRVGEGCKPAYAALWDVIRQAQYVYVDETPVKVRGKPWYLWTFTAPTGETLVVIRPTRSKTVAQEILGDDPPQVLVVDGYSGYKFVRTIQRCWAHLLRKVEAMEDAGAAGAAFEKELKAIFGRLKDALAMDLDPAARRDQKAAFDAELEALAAKHASEAQADEENDFAKALGYLRNGLGSWTTCLLHPGMAPTNNCSELQIREHAVVRKLIGSFHSEQGVENYQFISSLMATWRNQEKNPAVELARVLRTGLCGGEAGTVPPPLEPTAAPVTATPA